MRDALKANTATFTTGLATGNMDEYKAASYNICRAVKEAKHWSRKKLESQ